MPEPEDEEEPDWLPLDPLEPLEGEEEPELPPEEGEPLDDDELEGTVLHADTNARANISENL
jgi:hypothetical protein